MRIYESSLTPCHGRAHAGCANNPCDPGRVHGPGAGTGHGDRPELFRSLPAGKDKNPVVCTFMAELPGVPELDYEQWLGKE